MGIRAILCKSNETNREIYHIFLPVILKILVKMFRGKVQFRKDMLSCDSSYLVLVCFFFLTMFCQGYFFAASYTKNFKTGFGFEFRGALSKEVCACIFFYYSQKTGFDISCKLSPKEK